MVLSMEVDFLFINPWIYDFAAYDFWLKPFGLLSLAGKLRHLGYSIFFLDLLDPFSPHLPKKPRRDKFGLGHFYKEEVPKPVFFEDVPRKFFRYGLPFPAFRRIISTIKFKAVFLTCLLTYWYPGLFTLLEFFSKNYPDVPIFVGGIYVSLCKSHLEEFIKNYLPWAKINIVLEGEELISQIQQSYKPSSEPFPLEYPAFYFYSKIPYVVIMTSKGCPFNCPYCASKKIYPYFYQRNPDEVAEEIRHWYEKYKVKDFAFYDDALLFNFEKHLGIILEKLLSLGIKARFHTPNAVHARFITREVAMLFRKAGFTTLRFGFERAENRFDSKLTLEEFKRAIIYLKEAGFTAKELGAYVLYGIPDEDFSEVKKTLEILYKIGVPPYLAEFSPIPGTPFFERAKQTSRYPIGEDPIFHNNTVFPAFKKPDWEKIEEIKKLARTIRKELKASCQQGIDQAV